MSSKFDPKSLPVEGSPKTLGQKIWGRLAVSKHDVDAVGDPRVISEDGLFQEIMFPLAILSIIVGIGAIGRLFG